MVELGPDRHGVDDHGLLMLVVIEDDDLEQPARAILANDELPVLAGEHPDGVAYRVVDVLVVNAMLPHERRTGRASRRFKALR